MMGAGAADATEKKLDMSLDEIVEERKAQSPPANPTAGKAKNTKRSDRLAQAGPYPSRTSRHGEQGANAGDFADAGRRVYVGNLSWSVKAQDLKDHMSDAGYVEDARVMESNGRSKGCGIVTFETVEAAQHAIATLNDTEIDGRKIFVREDREAGNNNNFRPAAAAVQHDSAHAPRVNKGSRVYVGNLSWNVKWQDLKDHMKAAGSILHADVLLEEPNGRSKGCGLVEYSTPEEAQNAIATLNDTELEGRKIFVREDREPDGGSISSIAKRVGGRGGSGAGRAPPPQQMMIAPHAEGSSLYIGNLPWDVNWQSLKDLFRMVGDVDRAEVAQYPDGRSRGFGIVRFFNPQDAVNAIHRLNGTEVNGRVIEVRFDKSSH